MGYGGAGDDALLNGEGVGGDVGFSAYSLLLAFASEYLTTALGQPFEVGKTLLQVEWTPREDVAPAEEEVFSEDSSSDEVESDGEEQGAGAGTRSAAGAGARRRQRTARPSTTQPSSQTIIDNPEDAEAYFSDVISGAAGGSRPFVPTAVDGAGSNVEEALEIDRDAEGYLPDIPTSYRIRTDVSPSGSKGVWGMMRRVRRTPSEGLPGLWKGQLLGTAHSLLTTNLQPIVHDLLLLAIPMSVGGGSGASGSLRLNASLDLPLASHPHPAIPLGLHVAAHLITHIFLSPLELLRTRTIVQPSSARSTLSSPRMLREIVRSEGGVLSGLFFHPQLFLPAVLEHTLRPLFTLSIPLFIERQLKVTPDSSPVAYSILDLGLGLASLLVILPIETVRKRLQLQERRRPALKDEPTQVVSAADAVRPSIVRLRDQPYIGIVEAIYRIVTEETGTRKRRRRRSSNRRPSMPRRRSSMAQGGGQPMESKRSVLDGVRQLYRGVSTAGLVTERQSSVLTS